MSHRRPLAFVFPAIVLLLITYYCYLSRQNSPVLWRTWPDSSPTWPDKLDNPSPSVMPSPSPSPSSHTHTTKTLVIAKLQEDDTSWVDALVADEPDLTSAVYTVDNHTAPLSVPTNKGHEAMVYLSYIIDHYASLPDVSIFMHAHQITWHNNDFLDSDSATTVRRLRAPHVLESGYMNLRCHHEPGCPEHIHPVAEISSLSDHDLLNIPEAAVIGAAWRELFPGTTLPPTLSQPCCAQFAVSAARIRRIPRARYIGYRDWVLRTELDDKLSGRVWEYLWQWVFTGEGVFCPSETSCYCDGYGVCFGEGEYEGYFKNRDEARKLEGQVKEMEEEDDRLEDLKRRIEGLKGEMDAVKARVKNETAKG